MIVLFKNRKLDREFNTQKLLVCNRGSEQANKIMLRKTQLEDVDNMSQLFDLPGNYHPLTENKVGWYAASLDGPNRIIFIPLGSPYLNFLAATLTSLKLQRSKFLEF